MTWDQQLGLYLVQCFPDATSLITHSVVTVSKENEG